MPGTASVYALQIRSHLRRRCHQGSASGPRRAGQPCRPTATPASSNGSSSFGGRSLAAGLLLAAALALLPGCRQPFPLRPEPEACPAAELTGPEQPAAVTSTVSGEPVATAAEAAAAVQSFPLNQPPPEPPPLEPPPPEPLQPPPEQLPPPAESAADITLLLADVVQSVYESYPLLEIALREREIAEGKELAAWGEFDTGFKAYSLADPLAYYERYRTYARFDQPLPGGGTVYSGYKLGRGSFHPAWYDDQTNRGGEFTLGLGLPLLQNRLIDKRRSGLSQATLARQAVEPAIQTQLLDFMRQAAQAYWAWAASGQIVRAQAQLLRLAQDRAQQIEQRVESGDLERIALIDNQRLIALREAKAIDAERKLQMAAIKLSLFLRAGDGQPLLPDRTLLPNTLPAVPPLPDRPLSEQIQAALAARPELLELDLLAQQVEIELVQAENMLLPKMDALLEASQDVGAATVDKNTKGPFELEVGLYGEVPLQRRQAHGKIAAARGKLAQLRAKRQFAADKVAAQVQDAVSALQAASEKIARTATNLELSRQSLGLAREAFDAGDIDLIVLNIYEQSVADAQIAWIESLGEYFAAQADYQAALAFDPLTPAAP